MIGQRKDDHIRLCLFGDVESGSTLLDDVYLIHNALPEVDLDDVDTSTVIFNKRLSFPFIIGALTGGTTLGTRINEIIAKCAEEFQIGLYVGSQRIAIGNDNAKRSFRVVAENAPTVLKIANLGAPQIARLDERELADWINEAIEMIDADAIAVHLNPAQEAFQPEGEPWFEGLAYRLKLVRKLANRPLIIKEVGHGISLEAVRALKRLVRPDGIDVAGSGGTSFIKVECLRSGRDPGAFEGWGIPTACSICEVRWAFDGIVIASGGIRSGVEGAKAIALGANAFSMSRPILEAAVNGLDVLRQLLNRIKDEFKIAMFLTGSRSIADLSHAPIAIGPRLRSWLEQRGVRIRGHQPRRKPFMRLASKPNRGLLSKMRIRGYSGSGGG